jgi:uncharacterized protein YkwD
MLSITHSHRTRGLIIVLCALAAILASALSAAQAKAATTATDWTAVSANTATGTLLGNSVSLSGSQVWNTPTSVLDGGWTAFSGPAFSPALPKSDMLQISGAPGASYTIRFGAAVTDPTLHLGSLGSRITFPAGTSVTKVSGETGFTVTGTTVSGTPSNTIGSSGNSDASGTIKIAGAHSSITFTATPNYTGPADGILVQLLAGLAPGCTGADTPITASNLAAAEAAIVCLTNEERRKAGVKELKVNGTLMGTARAHSNDMVQRRYFAHNTPQGVTPCQRMTAAGYPWCAPLDENIRWRWDQVVTPRQFMYDPDGVKGWMQSPPHRAAILQSGATEIGVGLAAGNGDVKYPAGVGFTGTQNFGSRAV